MNKEQVNESNIKLFLVLYCEIQALVQFISILQGRSISMNSYMFFSLQNGETFSIGICLNRTHTMLFFRKRRRD